MSEDLLASPLFSPLPPRVTILHVLASCLPREVQQYTLSLVSCSSSSLGCQSHGHQCYLMTLGWERGGTPLPFFLFQNSSASSSQSWTFIRASNHSVLFCNCPSVILVCGRLLCTEPWGGGDACFFLLSIPLGERCSRHPIWMGSLLFLLCHVLQFPWVPGSQSYFLF